MKFNKRVLENVHKICYIANVYKQDNMVQLSKMFQIPPIEFNAAAWAAVELGYLAVDENNIITLKKQPAEYQFGELVDHLLDIVPFTISEVNKKESVLEETYFQNWTAGFPQQDVIVAVKWLIEREVIAQLEIKDVDVVKFNREQRRKRKDGKTEETIENMYYFYTLAENADKDWHEKQFKDAKNLQKEQPQAE